MRPRPDPLSRLAALRRPPEPAFSPTAADPEWLADIDGAGPAGPVSAAAPASSVEPLFAEQPERASGRHHRRDGVGSPAVRPPGGQSPVIGGWVPDVGSVDDPVDSHVVDSHVVDSQRVDSYRFRSRTGDPGSEPGSDWSSWPNDPADWEGAIVSDRPGEQSVGAVRDDRRSGPTGGPADEDCRERTDEDPGPQNGDRSVRRRAVRAPRLGRHWGRFAELWVPEPLRDARVDPTRRGALILLIVAALAAVVTAVGVWRNQPEPRPVPVAASAATVIGPAAGVDRSAGAPSPEDFSTVKVPVGTPAETASMSEIVVSVTGLVGRAGLVTLPPGARVADAIAAAGGATSAADLTGVNLAAKLTDGDSIVLGDSPAGSSSPIGGTAPVTQGPGSPGGSGSALVNLNLADEAALDSLPGVGPVMAHNILAWRAANGTFTSIEQLQEINGIGPSRYAQLSPLVTV